MPASGPVSTAEQCSAGPWALAREGGGVDGVQDGVGVWGGSTHRIISARQDAFVRSQPGQIKLEILRFQKRRRMGNGNGTLVRLLRLQPLCCCALNMNAK